VARDRDLLMRFYLHDEDKALICRELNLSEEHFNRVIFRARNRFRELLEHRGYWKADLLSLAALTLCLAASLCAGDRPFPGAAAREPLTAASRLELTEIFPC